MSIRGIDGQMMINRTTEYVKDASAQIRRGEVAQDFLAHQSKAIADLQRQQVTQLEGKESPRVRTDEKKESGGQQGEQKRKKKRAGAADEDAFVPDDPTVGISPPKKLDMEI